MPVNVELPGCVWDGLTAWLVVALGVKVGDGVVVKITDVVWVAVDEGVPLTD